MLLCADKNPKQPSWSLHISRAVSFINLEGERESLHRKGEQYKERVIEFLNASGYRVVKDSSTHGITADLICKKPEAEGTREFYVEVKDSDLSRFDQSLLREMARYFLSYIAAPRPERFDLLVFVRKTKATNKWKHIFDNSLRRDNALEEYYQRVVNAKDLQDEEQRQLARTELDDFREFIADCDIYQGGYESLARNAEDLNESGRLISDFFLREQEPITDDDSIRTNFYAITKLPGSIYISKTDGIDDYSTIYDLNPHYSPIWLEGDEMFTLLPPDEMPETLTHFIDEDTTCEKSFDEWSRVDETNRKKTVIALLKRFVTYQAVQRGCTSTQVNGDYRIFIEHEDLSLEEQQRNELQVSRVFYDEEEEGRHNPQFVRHRAVTIDVTEYDDEYYLFLIPTTVYTDDGSEPIEGKRAKALDDKFGVRESNNRILRYVQQWSNLIGIGESDEGDGLFGLSTASVDNLSLPVRPVTDSDEQDSVMMYRNLSEYE